MSATAAEVMRDVTSAINIIRFINTGYQIVGEGYGSIGIADDVVQTARLKLKPYDSERHGLLRELLQSMGSLGDTANGRDSVLMSLSRSCYRVGTDLLVRLSMLSDKGTNPPDTQASMEEWWPKKNLDALTSQLQDFRVKMELLVLPRLKEDIERIGTLKHLEGDAKLNEGTKAYVEEIRQGRAVFFSDHTLQNVGSAVNQRGDKLGPLITARGTVNESILREQAASDKGALLQEFILEHLGFASMNEREEEVAVAHKQTFEWIFEREPNAAQPVPKAENDFMSWLYSADAEMFWINGKAGSGKSTLMRFVFGHKRTMEALKSWAGSQPLTVAAFFFWVSGTLEQRSQTGLLRQILHQLLTQHSELMPFVFPKLWERCWNGTTQERIKMTLLWSLEDLIAGLKYFLAYSAGKTKTAIFIDGLDEFGGDPNEMIRFLNNIIETSKGRVKICVSSRPWSVFEDAFSGIPSFKLQDLTSHDMIQYVEDKLINDSRVGGLVSGDAGVTSNIGSKMLKKADGVFLWIVLSCDHLLRCIGDIRTTNDIIGALAKLPTDLDDLFRLLLYTSKPKDHIELACQMFQLLRAREVICEDTGDQSTAATTLWEFVLAFRFNREISIESTVGSPREDEVLSFCQKMKAQVNDVCSGLLEVHKKRIDRRSLGPRFVNENPFAATLLVAQGKVTYLHRTVKDFLMDPVEWQYILGRTGETSFDPHQHHLIASLLQFKWSLESTERHRRLDERWANIVVFMTHARYAKDTNEELIDNFNATMNDLWLPRDSDGLDAWAYNCFSTYEERSKLVFKDPFLLLITRFGLKGYLESRLKVSPIVKEDGQPVLYYAVEYLVNRQKSVYPLSQTQLVEVVLKYGADPNATFKTASKKDETPWWWVLKCVRQAHRLDWIQHYDDKDDGTIRWVRIMKEFVRCGADPNAFIGSTRKDPALTALELVELVLCVYNSKEVLELRDNLIKLGARKEDRGKDIEAIRKAEAPSTGMPMDEDEEDEDVPKKPKPRKMRASRIKRDLRMTPARTKDGTGSD